MMNPSFRSLFAAYKAKDCEVQLEMNMGKLREKTWGLQDLWAGAMSRVFYPDGENENDEYGFACLEPLVATIKM